MPKVSFPPPAMFVRSLISAKRGDRIVYFEGDLAYSRWEEAQRKERTWHGSPTLCISLPKTVTAPSCRRS